MFKALAGIVLALVATLAHAERIRDLTSVQGVRENSLIGYGLVVGLDGTGKNASEDSHLQEKGLRYGRPDDPDAIYHSDAE